MRDRSHRRASRSVKLFWVNLGLILFIGAGIAFISWNLGDSGEAPAVITPVNNAAEETTVIPSYAQPIVTETDVTEAAESAEASSEEVLPEEIPAEPEEAPEEPVTLFFTGDVMLAYLAEPVYRTKGIGGLLDDALLEEMQSADILMINQEFPFGTTGTQAPDKQYTFRVDPKYVSAFTEMGVDIVSLANNHTLDYGRECLEQNFGVLDEAGIPYVGAGKNLARAKELIVIEVGEKKFGFLSASRVIPVGSWNASADSSGLFTTYDPGPLLECIRQARDEVDYLTVFVHWGIERNAMPEDYQRTMGRQYIEAGADLVIGAHPHVLQGIEYFDGKPVFYSLGNYIFNNTIEKTAAVKVTVSPDGEATYELVPASAHEGQTALQTGEKAEQIFRYMESISEQVTVGENGLVTPAAP